MSETSYLVELREAAPQAPERLRGLVRSMPAVEPRFALRMRPALSGAIALLVVFGLGAAIFSGLSGTDRHGNIANYAGSTSAVRAASAVRTAQDRSKQPTMLTPDVAPEYIPQLTAKSRLQRQDIAMNLRVEDLSAATQRSVRTTRRLGGFV